MVRRTYPQRTLVEVLLPDADKLWDPVLRQIDLILGDEDLVDQVTAALTRRHPQSARRGRLGTPAAVVLRMLSLKHLSDWSFDECEREVRGLLPDRRRARAGRQDPGFAWPTCWTGRSSRSCWSAWPRSRVSVG
jgi:hypothetical protein